MRKRYTLTATAAVLVLVGGFGISQSGYADEIVVRVYDRAHHDYHNWDANEEKVYRSYREGRHEAYRGYRHVDHKRQREYWNWRHEHPDSDRH